MSQVTARQKSEVRKEISSLADITQNPQALKIINVVDVLLSKLSADKVYAMIAPKVGGSSDPEVNEILTHIAIALECADQLY